jgi:hypothetical protein
LNARPDFRLLVHELLRFEKVGIFLLTERGHGLDSFNIETTATRLSDGGYILNTPREEAAKYQTVSYIYLSLANKPLRQVYAGIYSHFWCPQGRLSHGPFDRQRPRFWVQIFRSAHMVDTSFCIFLNR